MSNDEHGSITRLLGDLKGGDHDAARPLLDRYFQRLVLFARARLKSAPCSPMADEEDAALSAFGSFCEGAAGGQIPRLDDREALWKILARITANKVVDQARRDRRLKRGGPRVRDESVGLDAILGREPNPADLAVLVEQYHRLIDASGDDGMRRIARLMLDGHTLKEIAAQTGQSRTTTVNKLRLIRARCAKLGETE